MNLTTYFEAYVSARDECDLANRIYEEMLTTERGSAGARACFKSQKNRRYRLAQTLYARLRRELAAIDGLPEAEYA